MAVAAFGTDGVRAALTPHGAHAAARRWAAAHPRPFGGRRTSAPRGEVLTAAFGGTNLFHSVDFTGGGFAVFAASGDGTAPLAFSSSGTFCETNASPLWTMLLADTGAPRARRGTRPRMLASPSAPTLPDGVSVFRTAPPPTRLAAASVQAQEGLDDLRVAPLVKSTWDQGDIQAKHVYNSCTPFYSNCGCVATAMAQIMRRHEWPAVHVAGRTKTCTYKNETTPLAMQGGVYDWPMMPLLPDASITDAQRLSIGALTRDIGVSIHMNYRYNETEESAALSAMAALAFTNTWEYAQAQYWDNYDYAYGNKDDSELGHLPAETFENSILSSIDAGFPCLLGIAGSGNTGHAIVADGYGYQKNRRYVHLNMGWSGSSDYWYTFPVSGFAYLTDVVYNIFPTNTGNIVSGRVTDANGAAAGGVRVRAFDATSNLVATAFTSSTGTYALLVPNEPLSLTITASCFGGFAATNGITTSASASYCFDETELEEDPIEGYGYVDGSITPSVGNRWGVDLTLEPRPHFLIRIR